MTASTGLAAAATACPAYPWPQDGAQRGQKVFMQSDCAACHSMLPYAQLREAATEEEVGPKAAEILVGATEDARLPVASARPVHGGGSAYTPDLTALAAKVQEGLRYNLYTSGGGAAAVPARLADGAAACQELKKKMVWLQFVQPYVRTLQAA